jgi:putative NIF3 family GTP cyclohydrolase 1 type 2
MLRKDFLKLTAFSGTIFSTMVKAVPQSKPAAMTAADLQNYLISLVPLPEKTVDRFIIGDPGTRIKKIATCWMPYWDTCKEAVKAGANVIVTHEPTFYTHWDLDEKRPYSDQEFAREQYMQLVESKKKWILDNGLVIIRHHDTLDALKDRGIPYSFGKFLGFRNEDIINSKTYYNVYRIKKQPASVVAAGIAKRMSEVGQPGVAFYGDPDYPVSTVGVGTGAICDPMRFADLKPDLAIAIDDSVKTWTQTYFARDTGKPLVIVNHGASEEAGIQELNRIIKEKFPSVETIHFRQGCTYKWITA